MLTTLTGIEKYKELTTDEEHRLSVIARMKFGGISVIKCVQTPEGHPDRSQFSVVQQFSGIRQIRNTGYHEILPSDILVMDAYELRDGRLSSRYFSSNSGAKLNIPITPLRRSEDELPMLQLAYDRKFSSNTPTAYENLGALADMCRAMDGEDGKKNSVISKAGDDLMEEMVATWLMNCGLDDSAVDKLASGLKDKTDVQTKKTAVLAAIKGARSVDALKGLGAQVFLGLPYQPNHTSAARARFDFGDIHDKVKHREGGRTLVRIMKESVRMTLERVVGVARSRAAQGELFQVHVAPL